MWVHKFILQVAEYLAMCSLKVTAKTGGRFITRYSLMKSFHSQVSQLSRAWIHNEAAFGGSGNGFRVPAAAPGWQRRGLPASGPGPRSSSSCVWSRVWEHAAVRWSPVLGPTGIPGTAHGVWSASSEGSEFKKFSKGTDISGNFSYTFSSHFYCLYELSFSVGGTLVYPLLLSGFDDS